MYWFFDINVELKYTCNNINTMHAINKWRCGDSMVGSCSVDELKLRVLLL